MLLPLPIGPRRLHCDSFQVMGRKGCHGNPRLYSKASLYPHENKAFWQVFQGGGDLALHRIIGIHPKLRNINPHNVTHSLISPNAREQMLVVQISLLIVTFPSLLSWFFLSSMQTIKEGNPHPRMAPCVNMWSVAFLFFFFFLCHLLNVGACVCHIIQEGQVEWITPTDVTGERIQIVLTSPLCDSILSHATLIL
jgi:hypothetical protein